jgi:hypothetical protein
VLAYIAWHRPAPGVDASAYERALQRFHRSLELVPPDGFRGSVAFGADRRPWVPADTAGADSRPGYEDWYLVDSWAALGVLEEAAVARGHVTRHDAVAAKATGLRAGVYRLREGHARLERARVSVWVQPASGHAPPTIADLLGDGMDPETAGLWRRCLVLGPAPEYCLLAREAPLGVADTRLPPGWHAVVEDRRVLW